jgi:hypothetical protein
MDTLTGPAIAALLVVTVCYGLRVWLVPFKTCRRCSGMGRIATRSGRGRPKACRHCHDTGLRPRLLRKAGRAAVRTWHQSR